MNIAYRFRIYPNREQEVLLAKTFGCCREQEAPTSKSVI
ncbi:MAG: helix-turn-helix domain-containing protein [Coprococcus catus]|nr:helix-turn-helix domain-containing protein [Dorea formicigenerans]MDY5988804.1 helix-turn-helix domain-containing protein [Coprococcus catus]